MPEAKNRIYPINDIAQLDLNSVYSYADYLTWKFEERVELIFGKIFKMSPSPGTEHQSVSGKLQGELYQFLKKQKCKVFAAPFDVRLDRPLDVNGRVIHVVQPDLCVICDPLKLDSLGCKGAPDLIIEILSPGSAETDLKYKFELYEINLVKEYWIVDPVEQSLLIYLNDPSLGSGQFKAQGRPLTKSDRAIVNILPPFEINLADIFE